MKWYISWMYSLQLHMRTFLLITLKLNASITYLGRLVPWSSTFHPWQRLNEIAAGLFWQMVYGRLRDGYMCHHFSTNMFVFTCDIDWPFVVVWQLILRFFEARLWTLHCVFASLGADIAEVSKKDIGRQPDYVCDHWLENTRTIIVCVNL